MITTYCQNGLLIPRTCFRVMVLVLSFHWTSILLSYLCCYFYIMKFITTVPPPIQSSKALEARGQTRLYRLTPTASIGLILPSNVALKYPCVPNGSLMKP